MRYYGFDEQSTPDGDPQAFKQVLAGTPLKTEPRDRLDFMSGQSIAEGVPRRPRGDRRRRGGRTSGRVTTNLRTISDDGVRVWMDDERIIDQWTPHESAVDAAPITGGRRHFKVEYYELGGFAELRFEILRR